MNTYTPYRNLPPLAGLCDFRSAQKPGLSVEECVRRLKRYHYVLKRLHEIFIARLPSEPIYELKMGFSYHAHMCAEHVAALRVRVGEMREPPLGLDITPSEPLAAALNELRTAPTTEALLVGIYGVLVPELIIAMEAHQVEANPLADAPSLRILKFALLELHEMEAYGAAALGRLLTAATQAELHQWEEHLRRWLQASGGLAGTLPPGEAPAGPYYPAGQAWQYDSTPKRDARFPDPYNMGVNAEAFLYDADLPPEPKVLMMFYKRLREIDVPEMMASIISETTDKPWAYYRDMTRQLWDEARHAMMGEVGFLSLGVDWPRSVMVNFTWSLGLNTQLTARERHGVLYYIEQGLMPKTGKRYEWETAQAAHNPLSAAFQDYDWADEVLHARVGRDWYVSTFDSPKEAVEWGDRCWSKVVMGWRQWKDEGLTEHRNWWPDLYAQYCTAQGKRPDPQVAGYDTSYETQRADLKVLSASA